jgi:hypothetical protein
MFHGSSYLANKDAKMANENNEIRIHVLFDK